MTKATLDYGSRPCHCSFAEHAPRLVAVTGGPGAGKTAVLELARRSFCEHVAIIPEAASIVFGGGFPRGASLVAQKAAQRAIYHVQRQLEEVVIGERRVSIALCDRGTLDGLAYWPDDAGDYWERLHTDQRRELARYHAVIHLATPSAATGYNHSNRLRIESASEAGVLDARILGAWSEHPRRDVIGSREDFGEKALEALTLLRQALPPCCHDHALEL